MQSPPLRFAVALVLAFVSFPHLALALSPEEIAARLEIKRNVFGGLSFQRAEQIAAGQAEPLFAFEARDSFFVNWEIPACNVAEFEQQLHLPAGFHLAKIRILEGERPAYYLSLNMYEVTIDVPSIRAEWSVYVTKGNDPAPRFMIVEAQSSTASFDPVLGPAPAADIIYERDENHVQATVHAPGTHFELSFDKPRRSQRGGRGSLQWAMANDFIYWTNGVADKAAYNGTLTQARMSSVRARDLEMVDETRWARFVSPKPRHVLLFNAPIELTVSPWANLNDPTLALDPAHRAMLQGVKASAFGGLSQYHASQVFAGLKEPLFAFTIEDERPAYFINFRVPPNRVQALSEALALPEGFDLAPIQTLAHGRPEFMISLNVYQASGIAAGIRAEWSVYVTPVDDPYEQYFMVIDVASSGPSLDVVNLFTPPAQQLSLEVDAEGMAHTQIINGNSSFSATFPVSEPSACDQPLDQSWVRANDRIYWRNGVYDRGFYNGSLLGARVGVVDGADVQIDDGTPWAQFVDPEPLEVFYFHGKKELRVSPWYNLEELSSTPAQ